MAENTSSGAVEAAARAVFSRRDALRKMGLTAGASVLAALTLDDLARNVIRRLHDRDADNALLASLDKEFSTAGVAFAASGDPCRDCHIHYCNTLNNNADSAADCQCAGGDPVQCVKYWVTDGSKKANDEYTACVAAHCDPGTVHSPCLHHDIKPCVN